MALTDNTFAAIVTGSLMSIFLVVFLGLLYHRARADPPLTDEEKLSPTTSGEVHVGLRRIRLTSVEVASNAPRRDARVSSEARARLMPEHRPRTRPSSLHRMWRNPKQGTDSELRILEAPSRAGVIEVSDQQPEGQRALFYTPASQIQEFADYKTPKTPQTPTRSARTLKNVRHRATVEAIPEEGGQSSRSSRQRHADSPVTTTQVQTPRLDLIPDGNVGDFGTPI